MTILQLNTVISRIEWDVYLDSDTHCSRGNWFCTCAAPTLAKVRRGEVTAEITVGTRQHKVEVENLCTLKTTIN